MFPAIIATAGIEICAKFEFESTAIAPEEHNPPTHHIGQRVELSIVGHAELPSIQSDWLAQIGECWR